MPCGGFDAFREQVIVFEFSGAMPASHRLNGQSRFNELPTSKDLRFVAYNRS